MSDVPFDPADVDVDAPTEEKRGDGRVNMSNIVGLTLSVIALALVAVVVAELATGAFVLSLGEVEVDERAAETPSAVERDATRRRNADVQVAIDRPLFVKTRRPPTEEVVVAPPPTLSLSLVGVILSSDLNIAIMRRQNGEETRVREGETIDGWRLVTLTVDHAVFESGGRRAELDVAQPWNERRNR